VSVERRIARIEDWRRKRPPPTPPPGGVGSARLDPCEQYELAELLARAEHRPGLPPYQAWDGLDALCSCQLDRLHALTLKAHGQPPAGDYSHIGPNADPCCDCRAGAGTLATDVEACRRVVGVGGTAA